jgi:hypothetical protein
MPGSFLVAAAAHQHLGEGAMGGPTLGRPGSVEDGRADEGMPEDEPRSVDAEEPGVFRRLE